MGSMLCPYNILGSCEKAVIRKAASEVYQGHSWSSNLTINVHYLTYYTFIYVQ